MERVHDRLDDLQHREGDDAVPDQHADHPPPLRAKDLSSHSKADDW
jgi:hypothetical protein